jgi:hypothetical protein
MTLGPKSKWNNAQTSISPIVKYKPPPKISIKFQNNRQILLDKESKIETKSQSSSRSSSFDKKLTTDSATRGACHFYTITSPPLFLRQHNSAFLPLTEPIRQKFASNFFQKQNSNPPTYFIGFVKPYRSSTAGFKPFTLLC